MRKLVILLAPLLVLALILSAVGCSSDDEATPKPTVTATPGPTGTGGATATPEPTPAGVGYTGESITFKFNHVSPAGSRAGENWEYFNERLQYWTDGKVKLEIFPMGTLFSGNEQWEAVITGAVDMADLGDITAMQNGLYDFMLGILAMWWGETTEESYDHDERYTTHPEGGVKLLAQYEERGIKGLGFMPGSPIQVDVSKFPIHLSEDHPGLKVRGVGGILDVLIVDYYGWTPVVLDTAEVTPAFEQGLIDSLGTTVEGYLSSRYYDFAKYGRIYSALVTHAIPSMNLGLWNSLSPELQDVIQNKAFPELRERHLTTQKQGDIDARAELEELGVTFYEMTNEKRLYYRNAVYNDERTQGYLMLMDPELVALSDRLRTEPYDEQQEVEVE